MEPGIIKILNFSFPIHQRYQMLFKALNLKGRILKTDLWNEVNTAFPIKADQYIEIDRDLCLIARRRGLNVICGSIEHIPEDDCSFDAILDFSTIDHVPFIYDVIDEYTRILKKSGFLLLVSWTGTRQPHKMENWKGYQYYHDSSELIDYLSKYFLVMLDGAKPYSFSGFEDSQSRLSVFFCWKK